MKTLARSLLAIRLLLVVALVAAGCSGGDEADGSTEAGDDRQPSSTTEARRVSVTTGAGTSVPLALAGPHLAVVVDEGGLCPSGACLRVLELSVDGEWHLTDASADPRTGTYDADTLADLARTADRAAIALGPFQGECPTAYDGNERSYLVFSPDDPATTVLDVASCRDQLEAGAPILVSLDLLITDAGA